MSGLYLRLFRDGKWETVLLEDATEAERLSVLKDWDNIELMRTIDRLCEVLKP